MSTEKIIQVTFAEICREMANSDVVPPDRDTILLESGLDSLGFAILVARLEELLGYDPFILMEEPVYPKTFGDFVVIYEKYKPVQ